MENEKSLLLKLTNETKMRIIDFLLKNKDAAFSKTAIAKGAGVSKNSLNGQVQRRNGKKYTYTHFDDLLEYDIIKPVNNDGRYTKFAFNHESEISKNIIRLELALMERSMNGENNERKTQ